MENEPKTELSKGIDEKLENEVHSKKMPEIMTRSWWRHEKKGVVRIFAFVGCWMRGDVRVAELWEVGNDTPIIYPLSEFEGYVKEKLLTRYLK